MITSLILLNLHSHWFSWLTNPVTTYVHLLIFNLSTDLLKTLCLWLTTKFTSICWCWSTIPLDIDMPRVDALLRASTSHALYRCPANSPARLLLQLHTQGNQCWWNTHTSLKNNMLAFVHAHEKVVNIRPVLHNYPSQSEAGLGITTSFGIGGEWFSKEQRQQPVRAATSCPVIPHTQKVDFPHDFDYTNERTQIKKSLWVCGWVIKGEMPTNTLYCSS